MRPPGVCSAMVVLPLSESSDLKRVLRAVRRASSADLRTPLESLHLPPSAQPCGGRVIGAMKRSSACIRSPGLDEEICHARDTNARPERGTSWPRDERPGSRSRIGILRRYRLRLPSEPGGSARENVALHFELAVLTPQTVEFLALG